MAATAPHLLCRALLFAPYESQYLRTLPQNRPRNGGVHGVIRIFRPEDSAIRARAAGNTGPGEPSSARDVESNIRTGLLGVGTKRRPEMAGALRPTSQS